MSIVTTNPEEPDREDERLRGERAGNKGYQRRGRQGVLPVDQCLQTLSGFPMMIAMGMLSVPKDQVRNFEGPGSRANCANGS